MQPTNSQQKVIAWAGTEQAKAMSQKKKEEAWQRFNFMYPEADKTKFKAEVEIDKIGSMSASINYEKADGGEVDVFIADPRYFSEEMKKSLGLQKKSGFPKILRENPSIALNVPAIDFSEPAPSLKKIFTKKAKIYATSKDYFEISFRDVFQNLEISHTTASESKKWLSGPNMGYWPQQLNFAVWCSTTGCGIGREIFDDSSNTSLPENVRSFYLFHVYFTIRRILFEMGGIQRIMSLPGDMNFDQTDNKYDVASYKRLCNEFGIPSSTDFRYTHGANSGLGNVWIWATSVGPIKE